MIKAAALTHAIAETARMEWKSYDESTVLNALYALGSLWGKERPGSVDVHVASAREVLPRYEQVLDQYLSALVRSLAQGPVEVHNCLHRIERIHDIDRDKVQSMLQDGHLINQRVALELGEVVQQLAAIRAASTIAFTLLGGGVASTRSRSAQARPLARQATPPAPPPSRPPPRPPAFSAWATASPAPS
ncbi:MAG: hypothetical protein IPJ98_08600 [Bryobacterales bacterium]|nr:hypothetical protein [Bryobacterales bacterium]